MIFLLVVSFLWGLGWVGFILAPLFSRSGRKTISLKSTGQGTKILAVIFGFMFFSGNSNVTIPGPTILPDSGLWVPAVNQYVLVPQEGYLEVYYVGMFTNTFAAKGTTVLLPLPRGFENWTLLDENADVRPVPATPTQPPNNQANQSPRFYVPLNPDINQIRGTFRLSAPWGTASWQAPTDMPTLPGVALILFSTTGEQPLSTQLVPLPPAGFQMIPGPPGNATLQLIRADRTGMAAFPSFTVENIVPTRTWVHVLGGFFALLLLAPLLGWGFFFISKTRNTLPRSRP